MERKEYMPPAVEILLFPDGVMPLTESHWTKPYSLDDDPVTDM